MTKEEIEQEVARLYANAGIVFRPCAGRCGKDVPAHEVECHECQDDRRNRQQTARIAAASRAGQRLRANASIAPTYRRRAR